MPRNVKSSIEPPSSCSVSRMLASTAARALRLYFRGSRYFHCCSSTRTVHCQYLVSRAKMSTSFSVPATVSLADFDAVGVDLDHTLCKYRLENSMSLIYKSLAEVVVKRSGCSKDLLKPFYDDRDFCTKGLVYDIKKGNFLKLSREGDILRACHGTTLMSEKEVCEIYGSQAKWEHFDFLKDTLKQTGSFRYFENYFDMPGSMICARLVDIVDKEAGKRQEEYTFWPDVQAAFNEVFERANFKAELGGYFPTYKKDPMSYIEPCSESIKRWFKSMKDAGKVTFLLTSSNVDYAESLLEHIMGKNWSDYFDISMMYARKPGYFEKTKEERPFYSIADSMEGEKVTEVQTGGRYLQGNVHTFHSYLKKVLGKENPKVAYFGDSIRSDIIPPNQAGWCPFLILEELEVEGSKEETTNGEETDGPPTKKFKGPPAIEKEFILSGKWGSFFSDQTEIHFPDNTVHTDGGMPEDLHKDVPDGDANYHSLNTLWGYFIHNYAAVAIPHLEFIADLPLDHRFSTFADPHSAMAGFFPHPPKSLRKK